MDDGKDDNRFDKMVAFKLCGGGYRRTGCDYPALELFKQYSDEGAEEEFLERVYDYFDEAVELKDATHGDDDMQQVAEERIMDMVYLMQAVVECIMDNEAQDEALSFIRANKAYVEECAKRYTVAIGLDD